MGEIKMTVFAFWTDQIKSFKGVMHNFNKISTVKALRLKNGINLIKL